MIKYKMPNFTTKMMMSYLLMALIAMTLGAGSVYSMKLSLVRSQDRLTENSERTFAEHGLHDSAEKRRITERLFSESPDLKLIDRWESADKNFSRYLKILESMDHDKPTQKNLDTIKVANMKVVRNWNSYVGDFRKTGQLDSEYQGADEIERLETAINKLVNSQMRLIRDNEKDAISDFSRTLNLTLVISTVILMIGLFVAFYLSSTLKKPLAQLLEGTQKISKGQLGHKIELERTDEIGALTTAFDDMSTELQKRENDIHKYVENLQSTKALLETYSHELESKNKELESFIYSVSHDLKSPLIAIQGFLSMFDHEFKDNLSDKAQYYLSRIQINGRQMHILIKQLLELSKVGQFENNLQRVDSRRLVEETLEGLSLQIELKHAIVKLGHRWPEIVCDPSRFKQAIANLVDNALHYNCDHRELIIEIGSIELDDYWRFQVSDNGMGIDPKYHDRIFDIFERLGSAHDLNQDGTGMGLAIVRKIAESHDGKITVESRLSAGSKFYFDISKKLAFFEPSKAEA
ncbi:MAG TPA: HAMP domain-containing protein [Actinobacteria bacterium]|nr:HAMP domain-containing protein [Actinomycetota bacterium]